MIISQKIIDQISGIESGRVMSEKKNFGRGIPLIIKK